MVGRRKHGRRFEVRDYLSKPPDYFGKYHIIFCRMVSVTGSVFRCRIDAFDNTLSCYSDRIAENYLNTRKKHQTSQ